LSKDNTTKHACVCVYLCVCVTRCHPCMRACVLCMCVFVCVSQGVTRACVRVCVHTVTSKAFRWVGCVTCARRRPKQRGHLSRDQPHGAPVSRSKLDEGKISCQLLTNGEVVADILSAASIGHTEKKSYLHRIESTETQAAFKKFMNND